MFTVDIAQLVPRFILRDKNGYALAKAIEAALQIMNDTVADGIACIADYDTMPEWRLDELAWEMDCPFYDYNADIDAKRATIKNGLNVYRTLGTRGGLQRLLTAIFGGCEVSEWFEYNGDPYRFRVLVDIRGLNGPEQLERALDAVQACKPARSIIEDIVFRRVNDEVLHTGLACGIARTGNVQCRVPASMDINYFTDENGDVLADENGNRFFDGEE